MNNILDFLYLRKLDLDLFGIKISDSEWDEIVINLSWINSFSMDGLFWVMKESNTYYDFIIRLVETKGTFPDSKGRTIQQRYFMYYK